MSLREMGTVQFPVHYLPWGLFSVRSTHRLFETTYRSSLVIRSPDAAALGKDKALAGANGIRSDGFSPSDRVQEGTASVVDVPLVGG